MVKAEIKYMQGLNKLAEFYQGNDSDRPIFIISSRALWFRLPDNIAPNLLRLEGKLAETVFRYPVRARCSS